MKLSEKKQTALYAAIAEPIMDLRINIQKYGSPSGEHLDSSLFRIQNEIWREVHKVLNIEGDA